MERSMACLRHWMQASTTSVGSLPSAYFDVHPCLEVEPEGASQRQSGGAARTGIATWGQEIRGVARPSPEIGGGRRGHEREPQRRRGLWSGWVGCGRTRRTWDEVNWRWEKNRVDRLRTVHSISIQRSKLAIGRHAFLIYIFISSIDLTHPARHVHSPRACTREEKRSCGPCAATASGVGWHVRRSDMRRRERARAEALWPWPPLPLMPCSWEFLFFNVTSTQVLFTRTKICIAFLFKNQVIDRKGSTCLMYEPCLFCQCRTWCIQWKMAKSF
jgi:hypothetical protein